MQDGAARTPLMHRAGRRVVLGTPETPTPHFFDPSLRTFTFSEKQTIDDLGLDVVSPRCASNVTTLRDHLQIHKRKILLEHTKLVKDHEWRPVTHERKFFIPDRPKPLKVSSLLSRSFITQKNADRLDHTLNGSPNTLSISLHHTHTKETSSPTHATHPAPPEHSTATNVNPAPPRTHRQLPQVTVTSLDDIPPPSPSTRRTPSPQHPSNQTCTEQLSPTTLSPTTQSPRSFSPTPEPTPSPKLLVEVGEPFPFSRVGAIEDYYEVGEVIGRGGFSVVHKGVSRKGQHVQAVKIIEKQALSKQERDALTQEITILKTIQHPYVTSLNDVLEDEEYLYLVMDYIPFGTLFACILRGVLSEHQAQWVTYQLASAVYYLSHNGICHRDIKPENVLVTDLDQFNVKLIDFGLAKNFREAPLKTPCGTETYAAPEVLIGEEQYTTKVDVWCIGMTTFVSLCGYQPFDGDSKQENLEQMRNGDVYFDDLEWGLISSDCKDFILGCLRFDAKDRLDTDTILMHQWLCGASVFTNPLFRTLLTQLGYS